METGSEEFYTETRWGIPREPRKTLRGGAEEQVPQRVLAKSLLRTSFFDAWEMGMKEATSKK